NRRQVARDVLIGRDYIISIDETTAGRNVMQRAQLNCFSRSIVASGLESGTYDYAVDLPLPGGTAYGQWQPVQGGLLIRAGADLLLLRGQRPPNP
ncbi:MAG TPA: hypothetical protein PKB10_00680, partial [Tepidisphaeraceae bacterium]|nr:hypothetical protein [Tepidisphaeraceae bacterium]